MKRSPSKDSPVNEGGAPRAACAGETTTHPRAEADGRCGRRSLFRGTSRLLTQIYLFGLATIVTVALLGFSGAALMFDDRHPPRPPVDSLARLVMDRVQRDAEKMPLAEALTHVCEEFDVNVTLLDESGQVVITRRADHHAEGAGDPFGEPRHRPAPPHPLKELPPLPPHMHQAGLQGPAGPPTAGTGPASAERSPDPVPPVVAVEMAGPSPVTRALVQFHLPKPGHRQPPFYLFLAALLVLAVTSFLFARWLARPLRKVSQAVSAFGSGDLTARARLNRNDELGAVGDTFDQMADRISGLMKAQKELVANVSHELRTPISRIRVALDIAQLGDSAAAATQLEGISADLAELEELLESVIVSTRLDLASHDGSVPLNRAPTPSRTILEDSALRFRSMHPSRRLVSEFRDPLPQVLADSRLLRRVIDNLLQNAAKYSEPESPIELRARAQNETLLVEVQDHGIGIASEDLERVFQPFYRTDPSRSRGTGGTGLGLTLARRVVEAHQGQIWLTSEPGRGTLASFAIPVVNTSAHQESGGPGIVA